MLGVEFRPGALVCMELPSNSDFPVFGHIQQIFVQDDNKKFLVQVCNTSHFSHHLFAYCIINTSTYAMKDVSAIKFMKSIINIPFMQPHTPPYDHAIL